MYVFPSMLQWHLKFYYKNRDNHVGVSHILRAYHLCKIYDMIFFKKGYDRAELKEHNRNFKKYWEAMLDDRTEEATKYLSGLHIEFNKKLLDIHDFINRFEKYIATLDISLDVQHGSWGPKMIAVEVI